MSRVYKSGALAYVKKEQMLTQIGVLTGNERDCDSFIHV